MTEVKGIENIRTQHLDDLRNRRRLWEPNIEKGGNDSLSHKHEEEIQVIIHKPMNLLTISIIYNNNNNNKLMLTGRIVYW